MMRLFLAGLALLLLAFFVHIVAWRVHLPRRSTSALLCIFAAIPPIAVAIYSAIGPSPAFAEVSLPDAVRVLLFYVACSLVYICVYSAIEVQSPSLAIVLHVASSGGAGCAETDFADHIAGEDSVSTRLAAMEAGKMIVVDDGRYTLTPVGRRWAELFEFAGHIFRLPLGG